MSPGQALAAKRGERGLSIEQVAAATRVRAEYLRALEADDLHQLPAPVYARGYMRTYATFLGLDAEEMVRLMPGQGDRPGLEVALARGERKPRFVLTTPGIAAVGLVLFAGAFAGYVWRQVAVDERPSAVVASPPTTAAGSSAPAASPAIEARPIVVGVRVTDVVWINVTVDGTPQYGDSGRTLPAGSVVYFTGLDVKVTSGKASATFITIDGHELGAMGVGVATREFSSQTAP